MAQLINESMEKVDADIVLKKQYFDDGSVVDLYMQNGEVTHGKKTNKDKSFEKWRMVDAVPVVEEKLTPEGVHYWYNVAGRVLRKMKKDGVTTTYYDGKKIESVIDENGYGVTYYENGNVHRREEKDYAVSYNPQGEVEYEYKDGRLTINPNYFSYYRIGVKTSDSATHWAEKVTLDPKKKTLLCLGGDQSKSAEKANGNIGYFAKVLGFTTAMWDQMQLVSCYRPNNMHISFLRRRYPGEENKLENDYRREILQKFMPFMAQSVDGKWERIPPQELLHNFRNIIIQAHCAGANDLPMFAKAFKRTMTKLGYEPLLQKQALRQILCITNNSQREMTDDLGFTLIHRYSVKDGQFEPEYDTQYSDAFPVFVQDHAKFAAKDGTKVGFIEMKANELLMVFSKILKDGDEHNYGFWTTDEMDLTPVGKKQAALMKCVGLHWAANDDLIGDVVDFVHKAIENTPLKSFVNRALAVGKQLKRQQRSVLDNPHILSSAFNKYKSKNKEPDKTGVYKLLSDNHRS